MITETFPAHEYQVTELRQSKIDPNRTMVITTKMRCPKCKKYTRTLEHGGSSRCSCGLQMILHGNALKCTLS
jgi:hypothetical protein